MGLCMVGMGILKMVGVVGGVLLRFDMLDLIQEGFCIAIPRMMMTTSMLVEEGEEGECMDRRMKREMIQLLVLKSSLQMWMVVIRIWMVREGLEDGVGGGKGVLIER